MYMFMQNSTKLSAAVHELSCSQKKKLATMLKTILPSLPWATIITIIKTRDKGPKPLTRHDKTVVKSN